MNYQVLSSVLVKTKLNHVLVVFFFDMRVKTIQLFWMLIKAQLESSDVFWCFFCVCVLAFLDKSLVFCWAENKKPVVQKRRNFAEHGDKRTCDKSQFFLDCQPFFVWPCTCVTLFAQPYLVMHVANCDKAFISNHNHGGFWSGDIYFCLFLPARRARWVQVIVGSLPWQNCNKLAKMEETTFLVGGTNDILSPLTEFLPKIRVPHLSPFSLPFFSFFVQQMKTLHPECSCEHVLECGACAIVVTCSC